MKKWKGWIIGTEKDRPLLDKLGITILQSKREINHKVEFGVVGVTEEMLGKLNPYWGQLVWGLKSYEE